MAVESNTWFRGRWYGPSYPDAGDLPGAEPDHNDGSAPEPPPKAGPGSSRAKWAGYAQQLDVQVPDGADRDAIIDACEKAGVPVDRPHRED